MKKLLVVLFLIPFFAHSQSLIGGKNIVKWNLSSMALKNYHFTFERHIFKNISFSLSYRTMPKTSIPFQDLIREQMGSNDIDFSKLQISNTAITPEARIYLGLRKMRGFYFAPYVRFATFDISLPVKYTVNEGTPAAINKEALMSGKIKSTSPGLMIGYQFHIATKIVLDFQIIGGHYGTSKGELNFPTTLNTDEQNALRNNLNEIELAPFKFTTTVNGNGAKIMSDGPWAGIRGINLGLGIRF
jgi:hypothetical protein